MVSHKTNRDHAPDVVNSLDSKRILGLENKILSQRCSTLMTTGLAKFLKKATSCIPIYLPETYKTML